MLRRGRAPRPPAPPLEPGARFDRLAGLVLGFALVVVALAALAVAPGAGGTTGPLAIAAGAALAAAVPALALVGLLRHRPWGRPVAILGLWLLIVSGLAQLAVSLVSGEVNAPFLAIAAGFVLVSAPRPAAPPLDPADRWVVRAAFALAVASLAWWAATSLVA